MMMMAKITQKYQCSLLVRMVKKSISAILKIGNLLTMEVMMAIQSCFRCPLRVHVVDAVGTGDVGVADAMAGDGGGGRIVNAPESCLVPELMTFIHRATVVDVSPHSVCTVDMTVNVTVSVSIWTVSVSFHLAFFAQVV